MNDCLLLFITLNLKLLTNYKTILSRALLSRNFQLLNSYKNNDNLIFCSNSLIEIAYF